MSTRALSDRAVRIEARAKLNLGLAVGPRRPDGFHELITVFQSISLADTLLIRPRARGFSLEIRHQDVSVGHAGRRASRPRIPAGADNLVLRAARALAERRSDVRGAHITLIKRIPVQAGLGGGSADAAATLIGLARLYRQRLTLAERMDLAAALGSDVPFAMVGGTALGRGRGERLTALTLTAPFRVLIAQPAWGVSTALAFRRIDLAKYGLTGWGAKLRFAQRLASERLSPREALALGNTFEQVLGDRTAAFVALRARLRACGVDGSRMTGSGSAVFGILPVGRSLPRAIERFEGHERLFAARSVGSAWRAATVG